MRRVGGLLFLIALLSGCGSGGKVAAVVNGHIITVEEIERRMSSMNPMARASFGNDPHRVLEQMVMESLLLQEARRRGLDRDSEVVRLMRDARRQILFGRLLEVLRNEGQPQIGAGEIQKYYEENRERFTQPEQLRAGHILVNDAETARKALERLKSGEPFADVARELSTDPTRTRGGDIGFFSAGQVIPEFEEACRKLKPGETSGVVQTPLGYHIILLAERRAAGQRGLEEVREEIRRRLEDEQRQGHVEAAVQELKGKAQIQIREEALPKPAAAEGGPASRDISGQKREGSRTTAPGPAAAASAPQASPAQSPAS